MKAMRPPPVTPYCIRPLPGSDWPGTAGGGVLPDEPEAIGLLALMLLHDARRAARIDANGEFVTLEAQDRSLWNRQQIAEGEALVQLAMRQRRPGPFKSRLPSPPCRRSRGPRRTPIGGRSRSSIASCASLSPVRSWR